MEHKKLEVSTLVFCSLAIVLNIIGALIALELRLPIYLDVIGTLFAAVLYGPWYGAAVGAITNLFNGFFFDPYSFYFLPVQLVLGLLTGYLIKKPRYFDLRNIIMIFVISLITSIISSLIATFVFEGVTSSGDTFVIYALKSFGLDLYQSVFSTEFIMTLIDRYISYYIAFFLINLMPAKYKIRFKNK